LGCCYTKQSLESDWQRISRRISLSFPKKQPT